MAPRLTGYCGLRTIVGMGTQPRKVVSISVTNIGTRSTVVNYLGFSVGRFRKKKQGILTVAKDDYSVGMPYSLGDGQAGHWGLPLDGEKSWLKVLSQNFIASDQDIETLRLYVYTSHGATLTLKPEENLKKALREVRNANAG